MMGSGRSEFVVEGRYARSFVDLEVYGLAREVARMIFERSRDFPPEERYSLTDQMRRASRSMGAQIAEAWAKRRYPKHFITKLTDADGEHLETVHWILVANDCGYLTDKESQELLAKLHSIGNMLHSMKEKADMFCQGFSSLREGDDDGWLEQ
jgi:four helix bundle protein